MKPAAVAVMVGCWWCAGALAAQTSTLDDVVSGGAATIRLDGGNGGTRRFVVEGAGKVRVTARLSTSRPASLEVKVGGTTWLSWRRKDDRDGSPLQENGKALAESIFERKPGDFSPKSVTRERAVQAGDVVELTLQGPFGSGNPELRLEAVGATGTVEGGAAGTNGGGSEVAAGSSKQVEIPFDRSWTITYSCTVTRTRGDDTVYGRLFTGPDYSIDCFTLAGRGLNFRLANKKIFFTKARVGSIRNPGGTSDHYLMATGVRVSEGSQHDIVIRYDCEGGTVKGTWDGTVVLDADVDVRRLPRPVKTVEFPGSEGVFEVELQ